MSNINIHRCTLRIVRHGGWGWGPEPRKLLQGAVNALTHLLARELEQLWPDDVEREYAAPVFIRVPLSISELLAAAHESANSDALRSASPVRALVERIGVATRSAFAVEQVGAVVTPREAETPPRADERVHVLAENEIGSAVLDLLLAWHTDGVLTRRLAAFSPTALEAWLERLTETISGSPDSESVVAETVEQFVVERSRSLVATTHERAATLRRRLIVATEAIAQFGLRRCNCVVLKALDRALPLARKDEAGAARLDHASASGGLHPDAPTHDAVNELAPKKFAERVLQASEHGGEAEAKFLNAPRASGIIEERGESSRHVARRTKPATDIKQSDDESQCKLEEVSATREGLRTRDGMATSELPPYGAEQVESVSMFAARVSHQQAGSPAETSAENFLPASAKPNFLSHVPPTPQRTVNYAPPPPVVRASLQLPRGFNTQHAASALPFLLLAPLSRVGYLKALAATMEAANALESLPLFAAALAYKVLAPTARGWRRAPDSVAAASAFAALPQPADEPALVDLARRLTAHLSPLDAALSGALINGHTREQPLLLMRTGFDAERPFLLLDVEGLFPLQWATSVAGLQQTLIELDSSIVLIPQASAGIQLLKWMDAENFRFITDAVPTREESWRALRRAPHERWWTNETNMSDAALMRVARAMRDAAEEAASLCHALLVERPGIPLAADAAFDRHLTLAASTALGTIAWELWRERELTTPLLSLARFSDLDARVVYSRDAVQVSLPLGKRYQDLRDHGLLEDVRDVPWYDGRTLSFASG